MSENIKKQPVYTLSEELLNAISHGVGTLLSVAALVVGVVCAALYSDVWCVVSMAIYGGTLIVLYCMSTLYHSLKPNKGKRVFRVLDHCSIFLLIAGTYTPYTLVALRDTVGWILFIIVWGAATLGVTLNAVSISRFKIFSMICYIAMGWVIIFAFKPLLDVMETGGIALLLAGGVAYTLGAVLYGLGKRRKYFHSVFHFFVLLGSVLQYFSVLFYVVLAL